MGMPLVIPMSSPATLAPSVADAYAEKHPPMLKQRSMEDVQ